MNNPFNIIYNFHLNCRIIKNPIFLQKKKIYILKITKIKCPTATQFQTRNISIRDKRDVPITQRL